MEKRINKKIGREELRWGEVIKTRGETKQMMRRDKMRPEEKEQRP